MADGTTRGGGGLLVCRDMAHLFTNIRIQNYTITVTVLGHRVSVHWSLTGVYGPQEDFDKRQFINKLCGLKHEAEPAWLILGDFN
jgi:hypothetical protein